MCKLILISVYFSINLILPFLITAILFPKSVFLLLLHLTALSVSRAECENQYFKDRLRCLTVPAFGIGLLCLCCPSELTPSYWQKMGGTTDLLGRNNGGRSDIQRLLIMPKLSDLNVSVMFLDMSSSLIDVPSLPLLNESSSLLIRMRVPRSPKEQIVRNEVQERKPLAVGY